VGTRRSLNFRLSIGRREFRTARTVAQARTSLPVGNGDRHLPTARQLGAEFLLVVRNLNPWDLPGALQPYAVAVCLWVEPTLPELYEEVRSRVEDVRVRVRNEIRI
jgi:hypothetical protein